MNLTTEARVTRAVFAHASVDAELARGLSEDTPVVVRLVACPGWPHAQLAWVVTGALSRPVVRYVAVTAGAVRVLTDSPAAFADVTSEGGPVTGREHVRDLALLFLETVRPMDRFVALLDSDVGADRPRVEAVRSLLGRDGVASVDRRWLALARLERLSRCFEPSDRELERTLVATLDPDLDDRSLRLLPARALDVDERERVRRDRDARVPRSGPPPLDPLAFDGYLPMVKGKPTGVAPWVISRGTASVDAARAGPFGAELTTLQAVGPPLRAALEGARLPTVTWTGQRGAFTAAVQVDDGVGIIQVRVERTGAIRPRWVWLS